MRIIVVVVLAGFVSACATVKPVPLSQEASNQLKGETVVRTQYAIPSFVAFTPGKAVFGVLGAAAAISVGNEIVKDNAIPDPAIAIGQSLQQRLVTARGVTVVPTTVVAAKDDITTLISTYPKAGLLLDVKTTGWMFNYYPTKWDSYKVTYSARVRLIDAVSKQAIAEGSCSTIQGDDANPPSEDQLLQNHAALLKEYLNKGATACVDVLAKQLLHM